MIELTPEQKEKIEKAAKKHADGLPFNNPLYELTGKELKQFAVYDFSSGVQYACDHPEEVGLFSRQQVIELLKKYEGLSGTVFAEDEWDENFFNDFLDNKLNTK